MRGPALLLALAALGLGAAAAGPLCAADREFEITSDGVAGRCHLPAVLNLPEKARAVVVFAHGSGPLKMDEDIEGVPLFKDLADDLAARGIASLRFDKRTSLKHCRYGLIGAPLDPLLDDIVVVFRRAQEEAPGLPVYLLGHSEGVSFVLELAAAGRLKPAGVILLAGSAHSIDQTLMRQLGAKAESPGEADQVRSAARGMLEQGKEFFAKLRAGEEIEGGEFAGASPTYWKADIEITARGAQNAASLKVPALLVQGDRDPNVTPEDFETLKAALQTSGGAAVYLSGLNHSFAVPGEHHADPSALNAVGGWLESRLAGKPQ